jgi:two-component sensor histidine kinase
MRAFSSLRRKSIRILAAGALTAAALAVAASLLFFSRGTRSLEADEARDSLLRARAIVEDDMDQLDVLVNDWAAWDETWDYVESRDSAFVEENLALDSLLGGLRISALFILDAAGSAVYEAAKDESWLPELETSFRKARPSSATGWTRIARAGTSLHVAAGRPILRSDGSGERRGTLVMTRRIDDELLARYSRLSGVSVRILPLPSAAAPIDPSADPRNSIRLSRRGGGIEAAMPISAAEGGTPVEIAISAEGRAESYGGMPLTLFIGAAVLIIAFAGMISIMLFEAAALGRMRAMNEELARIGAGEGVRPRLPETGDDELAALARSMNGTLDSLYAMIGERDAAIREIHHRVKNNLQVISSLVSLQAGKAGTADSSAFADIRRRVLAISYVHEELYLDREIERVDAERLFSRLTSMVADSYGEGARVRVVVECGRFSIDLERAVPIGLVVCEIATNSFRHAFPEGRAGTIRLSAESSEGGDLRLAIDDDGIGIPDGRAEGLGLSLVETLSMQIGAEFALGPRPGGGTSFRLTARNAAAR